MRGTAGQFERSRTAFAMCLMIGLSVICAPHAVDASIVGPDLGPTLGLDASEVTCLETLDATFSKLTNGQLADAGPSSSSSATTEEESGAGTSSRSAPVVPRDEEQPRETPQYALTHGFSPFSTSGGSSTSTSSSASGAPGGPSLAVLHAPAAELTDTPPMERYAAELSLFLPEPPGTELLRPPQGRIP